MSDPMLSLLNDAAAMAADVDVASVPSGTGVGRDVGVSEIGVRVMSPDSGTKAKLYSVVKVDRSDPDLCFGLIGVGSAFCFKRNCKVKNHMDHKIAFPEDVPEIVVIQRLSPLSAFPEPYLRADRVPQNLWGSWSSKTLSLPDWVKEFQAIACADGNLDSAEDLRDAASFVKEAEMFKTPSKRKRDTGSDAGPFGNDWIFVGHERILFDDPLMMGQLKREKDDTDLITKAVVEVETSVIGMGVTLERVTTATLDRFESNERDSRLMAGAIQNMKTTMGSSGNKIDDKFASPTLWGTAAAVASEVTRVGKGLDAVAEDLSDVKSQVSGLVERVRIDVGSKDATDRCVQVLTILMKKVKELSPEVSNLKVTVGELLRSSEARTREHEDRDEDRGYSKKLRGNSTSEEVERLRKELDGGCSLDGPSPSTIDRTLESLVSDVASLKAAGDVSAIKFAGLGFKNLQDCHEWAKLHFHERRFGLIMDPLLMLDRIQGEDILSGASSHGDSWKAMESKIKLQMTTGAETSAIEALSSTRPRMFHSGRASTTYERNKSRLNLLLKHADWKSSGGGGVRDNLVRKINSLQSIVMTDINHSFDYGGNPRTAQAHLVATLSLTSTVTSLTQLIGAVDAIFDKLHFQSKFSAESAWCLTMQILDKVCEDLYGPKEGVMKAITLGDPDSMCAHVLYSCFKSHDVMMGYVEHQFENHPAVSTEFIRFLATNSGSDKVEHLAEKVNRMDVTLKKTAIEATKGMAKADTATNKVAELSTKLDAAIRRIGQLETRSGNRT